MNNNITDTDQFDLDINSDCFVNNFSIVHIKNKSEIYNLTRQVLIDCAITQGQCCFFNHILTKTVDEFNETYGSFACLIARSNVEADLFLNVDTESLKFIIDHIQTSEGLFYKKIVDLASIFGMPKIVSKFK